MARAYETGMNFYELMLKGIAKSTKGHTTDTVIVDSGNFKVVAVGTNAKKLSQKIKTVHYVGVPIVCLGQRNRHAA